MGWIQVKLLTGPQNFQRFDQYSLKRIFLHSPLPVDLPCHRASLRAISPPTPKGKGSVAQLVEQGIENPCVGGSIPSRATFFLFSDSGSLWSRRGTCRLLLSTIPWAGC